MGQFGSLVNMMIGQSGKNEEPEVGMGATMLGWTDRNAATIVEVNKTKTRIGVQRDKATRIDDKGMTDSGQEYTFERDPGAHIVYYSLRKNGRWIRVGEPIHSGARVAIGYRDEYYDFSF